MIRLKDLLSIVTKTLNTQRLQQSHDIRSPPTPDSLASLTLLKYCIYIHIIHISMITMNITLLGNAIEGPVTAAWRVPLYTERVPAGFPSPAQDYIEQTLDLNELCISHPAATFFVRVEGESMTGAGIFPNDILVVDRSLTARHGDIVIASLEREMTVKLL